MLCWCCLNASNKSQVSGMYCYGGFYIEELTYFRERKVLMFKYQKISEKIGLLTQACKVFKLPVVGCSTLRLQMLCLGTLNKHLNRFSLEDIVDFLKKGQKNEPLNFHFMDWWWLAFKDKQLHSKMHQNPSNLRWLIQKKHLKSFLNDVEQL